MNSQHTKNLVRRILLPCAACFLAFGFAAPIAASQGDAIEAARPATVKECAPADPTTDHAINTKGAGGSDRSAASDTAACPATAEPAPADHAIHPACQNAADKIACNRFEDYKATHKDD